MKTDQEKLMIKIESDLKKVESIIKCNIEYPEEDLEYLQSRITANTKKLNSIRNKEVTPGRWVQFFTGGSNPIFAKVIRFSGKDKKFVVLEGVYNFDKDGQRSTNSFPVDWCLPVSNDLGRQLEYANGHKSKRANVGVIFGDLDARR